MKMLRFGGPHLDLTACPALKLSSRIGRIRRRNSRKRRRSARRRRQSVGSGRGHRSRSLWLSIRSHLPTNTPHPSPSRRPRAPDTSKACRQTPRTTLPRLNTTIIRTPRTCISSSSRRSKDSQATATDRRSQPLRRAHRRRTSTSRPTLSDHPVRSRIRPPPRPTAATQTNRVLSLRPEEEAQVTLEAPGAANFGRPEGQGEGEEDEGHAL